MMTGRLQPYLPELSIRDYNTYLQDMRGVGYQVYLDYGFVPYSVLLHKGAPLALLADSLAGRQATCQMVRMPGSLARVPMMSQTMGIRLAAQIEILMSWHRLQDRRSAELPAARPAKPLPKEGFDGRRSHPQPKTQGTGGKKGPFPHK